MRKILDSHVDEINKYIRTQKIKINDYNDSLKAINNIVAFSKRNDIKLDESFVIALLKENYKFYHMVSKVVEHINNCNSDEEVKELSESLILIVSSFYLYNEQLSNSEDHDYDDESGIVDNLSLYFNEMGKYKVLTPDEEKELFNKVLEGDTEAKNEFIGSNLKLVVSIAKKYVVSGVTLDDLIQEGNIGLMNAVDRFQPSMGFKFSTYASFWIKQRIIRAIPYNSRNIVVPFHTYEKLLRYKKAVNEMTTKLGREPTITEMANRLNYNETTVKYLQILDMDTVSINSPVSDEKDTELGEFIESKEKTPEERVIDKDFTRLIYEVLNSADLSPREFDIIVLRNGLDGKEPMTLQAIGDKYNITREAVRVIELRSLKKIRGSALINELAGYLDHPTDIQSKIYKANEKVRKHYSYQRNYNNSKEGNLAAKKGRRTQDIRSYFFGYRESEIVDAIAKLTEEEREILLQKYGKTLDQPSNNLSSSQLKKFYSIIAPKMINFMENERCDTLTEEDYTTLREIITGKLLKNYENEHDLTKAVIILLRFGHINNKNFSNTAVMNLLNKTFIEIKTNYDITPKDVEKVNRIINKQDKRLKKK